MTNRRTPNQKLATLGLLFSSVIMPITTQAAGLSLMSFEKNNSVKNISTASDSQVSISQKHAKDGKSSLKWQYKPGANLIINRPIGFTPFVANTTSQARDSFMSWVYNETPSKQPLTFVFSTDDTPKASFKFGLNFSGWRAIVVPFEDDMQGKPSTDMNKLTISAPNSDGELYFDQLALNLPVDPRWPTPDYQIPFINKTINHRANAHWGALLQYDSWLTAFDAKPLATADKKQLAAIATIKQRVDNDLLQSAQPLTKKQINKLLKKSKKLTRLKNGKLKSVQMWRQIEVYHRAKVDQLNLNRIKKSVVRFQVMGKHLLKLAHAYRLTDKAELKKRISEEFSLLVNHVLEQGYTRGSAAGIMHHQGYSMRQWSEAIFLGREMLKDDLQAAAQATGWLAGFGRIFRENEDNFGFNVDVMNTFLPAMLMSALLEQDSNKSVAYLSTMAQWMSYSMLATKGLAGGIQPDGSFYHHSQHYVAYGNGGLRGLAPVVYYMGATPFALDKPAYQRLRHATLMTRVFSNGLKTPMSLAGRHPEEYTEITLSPFKYLTLMGDKTVAKAYLRLTKDNPTSLTNHLIKKGVTPEASPNGSWTMNYSSMAIHRQDEWLATARGFSRYLVGNESYRNANHFGRYINYGHLEILPSSHVDSGFSESGWDWNRWSGTTTTHLPLNKLAAQISQVDQYSGVEEMLLSDQTFSGANNLGNQASMFAMKLHGHAKYDASLNARKSVFFFNNQVIALGSGINSDDKAHATETTLFQQTLPSAATVNELNGQALSGLDINSSQQLSEIAYLRDLRNNAYFVAPNQQLRILRQTQQSQENEQKRPTSGDFVTALIDHGKAPNDGFYQYSILINASNQQAAQYQQQLTSSTPPYQVLQRSNNAHVVQESSSGIVGYSLFEAHTKPVTPSGLVLSNSAPIMLMAKQHQDTLRLAVTDPDLNFYQGTEQDQLDENGQQTEVSIYSRQWRKVQPQPKVSQLTLKGQWQGQGSGFKVLSAADNKTLLEITSISATPIQITLQAVKG